MKNFILILILGSIIVNQSCLKSKCSVPQFQNVSIANYDSNKVNSITISKYELGSDFKTFIDSSQFPFDTFAKYSGTVYYIFSEHYDYLISTFPDNKAYKITRIGFGDEKEANSPLGNKGCVTSFSYSVNGKNSGRSADYANYYYSVSIVIGN